MNINGTDTERGQCIRQYRESTVNTPVKDPKSKDLRCRSDKMNAADTKMCTIVAGEPFGLEFHEGDEDTTRFIEPEHRGPGMIYMTELNSDLEKPVWFKVFEKGYDKEKKQFFTQELMKTKGKMQFTIPEDIPGGDYILRAEFIALHTADKEFNGNDRGPGAEFFPNCAQIRLISQGTAKPKRHSIPGIYTSKDPGILFNLWDDDLASYKIPGPPLYTEELGESVPQEGEGEPEPPKKPVKKPCVRKNKNKKRRSRF